MTQVLKFRTLEDAHLHDAWRMSTQAGWPHRLEDWAFVARISNGVVAMEGDRVVATALATPFAPVAMVNLIVVDAAMRGRGLGRDITCRAMQTMAPAAWKLVATKDGLPLYEKLGFQVTQEICQHQGPVGVVASKGKTQWGTADDLDAMLALDTATTGMGRQTLYAALAGEARFAVLRDDAGVSGFATVRDFGYGEVAGPVIARTPEDAQSLLALIMAERRGQFLRVDTGANAGLGPWLTEQGLPHVGGGLQMQKGELPESLSSSHTVFALASQALG